MSHAGQVPEELPGLEAAAVVTAAGSVDAASVAAVRELAPGAPVLRADPSGAVVETLAAEVGA